MVIINQSIFLWKHLLAHNISTDEDPRLRIESFAIENLRDVSTKLYFKCIVMNRNTVHKSYLLLWSIFANIDSYKIHHFCI